MKIDLKKDEATDLIKNSKYERAVKLLTELCYELDTLGSFS